MKLIGIAGGSGAGKSAISYALIDRSPDLFDSINLDDYQKLKTDSDLPMVGEMINWDHPDIINWKQLLNDVRLLQSEQSITFNSWAHRSNTDYHIHSRMVERIVEPKPYIIIEGYLALFNNELRKMFDHSFYFELDEHTRNERRDKGNIITENEYEEQVLIPMHKEFVEPTKAYARYVIDVSGKSIHQICDLVESEITI